MKFHSMNGMSSTEILPPLRDGRPFLPSSHGLRCTSPVATSHRPFRTSDRTASHLRKLIGIAALIHIPLVTFLRFHLRDVCLGIIRTLATGFLDNLVKSGIDVFGH